MYLIVCIDIFLTQCKCFFAHNYTAVCISKKGGPSKRIHIWGSLALKGLKASGLTNQYRNYKVTILLILNKKTLGKREMLVAYLTIINSCKNAFICRE